MKTKSLISLKDLQRVYEDMYLEIMRYVWSFEAVKKLADLEVATYNRFPDLDEVRKAFSELRRYIEPTVVEDEELKKAVENFESVINSANDVYAKIMQVREDITNED